MKYGTNFPQAIGTDTAAIRDAAQAIEDAGFDYMLISDHVSGIERSRFGPDGPPFNFTSETPTHEVFTLLGFLSAVTTTLEFCTNVLLLPQRQTVLAAKQAAEVANLSGGRLRLATGVGWNEREYISLQANFHNRGLRIEEQIEVMQALWTQPDVTYSGRYHQLDGVGINPLPQHHIPVWIGGGAEDPLLRRVAKRAEGWMPLLRQGVDVEEAVHRLHGHLRAEGRDPAPFGLDVRLNAGTGGPEEWVAAAKRWQDIGATHIVVGANAPGKAPLQAIEDAGKARTLIAVALG